MPSFNNEKEKTLWKGGVNRSVIRTRNTIGIIFSLLPLIIGVVLFLVLKNKGELFSSIFLAVDIGSIGLIIMIFTFVSSAELKKRQYIITNEKISVFSGLLSYSKRSINIENITGYDYIYTFLDRHSAIDCASVDFTSPSIHTQSYVSGKTASKYCFLHIGKEEAEKVIEILNKLKKEKK